MASCHTDDGNLGSIIVVVFGAQHHSLSPAALQSYPIGAIDIEARTSRRICISGSPDSIGCTDTVQLESYTVATARRYVPAARVPDLECDDYPAAS